MIWWRFWRWWQLRWQPVHPDECESEKGWETSGERELKLVGKWRELQLSEDYRAGNFCHIVVVVALTCQGPQPLLWYTIQLMGNLTRLLNLLIPGDHHEPLQGKDGQAHNRLNPYKTNISVTQCTAQWVKAPLRNFSEGSRKYCKITVFQTGCLNLCTSNKCLFCDTGADKSVYY